jgi:CRP/FNR family transcriptional regulator, cyclic AMP receptor protein
VSFSALPLEADDSPKVTLAERACGETEIIATTRSRVSYFMNKFRRLGFIDYNGTVKVHSSLLTVVLSDDA